MKNLSLYSSRPEPENNQDINNNNVLDKYQVQVSFNLIPEVKIIITDNQTLTRY